MPPHDPEEPVLQNFEFSHLKSPLREVSKRFHDLAWDIAGQLPANRERTKALDRLLESKDAAVRAMFNK